MHEAIQEAMSGAWQNQDSIATTMETLDRLKDECIGHLKFLELSRNVSTDKSVVDLYAETRLLTQLPQIISKNSRGNFRRMKRFSG